MFRYFPLHTMYPAGIMYVAPGVVDIRDTIVHNTLRGLYVHGLIYDRWIWVVVCGDYGR